MSAASSEVKLIRETEAKIALHAGEMDCLRALLVELGAQPRGIDQEQNVVFHLKTGDRRSGRKRLRLRTFGGRSDAVLTCKGPAEKDSIYKSRDELEVQVSDADSVREMLRHLGFRARVEYRKRREHWSFGETLIGLDQLAFGDFLEVEGTEQAILATLSALGLADRRHVRPGYARLARRAPAGSAATRITRLRPLTHVS
jgi:predicted adenylyl cyclase CyaB